MRFLFISRALVLAGLASLAAPGCSDPGEKFPAKAKDSGGLDGKVKPDRGGPDSKVKPPDIKVKPDVKVKSPDLNLTPDSKVKQPDSKVKQPDIKVKPDMPALDGPLPDKPLPPDLPPPDLPIPPDLPVADLPICPPPTACSGYIHSDAGACVAKPVKYGTICDDKKACTKGDVCDGKGACGGSVYTCADTFTCTTDTCDGKGGCKHTVKAAYCVIDNACHKDGAPNPVNKCQYCQSKTSATVWTLDPACKTLKNGLVAFYPFTGNYKDESGNANHGTAINSTLIADRFNKAKSAAHTNGINACVKVPHSAKINFGQNQNFSIALWVKIPKAQPTLGHNHDILNKWNSYSRYPFTLRTFDSKSTANGKILFGKWDIYKFPHGYSKAAINDDKWHHLVLMNSGSKMYLYIDGKLSNSFTDTTGTTSNGDPLYLGCRGLPPNHWRFYKGGLDDLRIYDRALTSAEVTKLSGI